MNPKNKHLTFVLYDSIENSVFESMVLFPLMNLLDKSENLEITLISFEKSLVSKRSIMRKIPAHDKLHLILCRRLPFAGKLSLWLSSLQLKKILSLIPSHEIIARGPLAGWIALNALNGIAKKKPERLRANHPDQLPHLTVQARGLCAEEYRFSTQESFLSKVKYFYHTFIYSQLAKIEFEVYRNKRKTDIPSDVSIEAVSSALKEYLVTNFRADPSKITLSIADLPKSVAPDQRTEWRNSVRQELLISPATYVYTYAGSAKPWQCVREMVSFFAERLKENSEAIFLVITPDKKEFERQLAKRAIFQKNYRLVHCMAKDVYKYLSAADAGLLFRRTDVINWTSRPTKMLEYQAVGLEIIHNDTIEALVKKQHLL